METAVIKSNKKFFTVQRMALCAIFAALIVVCSWVAVPSPFAPGVNFTLQTFAIILAGLLLSPLEALCSSVVYILLGVVGLPILSNFTTIYAKLPTVAGGYIIGFFIAPFLISLVKNAIFKVTDKPEMAAAKKHTVHTVVYIVVAIVIGILAVDIPGVIQGKLLTGADWGKSIVMFAISFMPTDILKCVVAAIVATALEKPVALLHKEKY